MRKLRASIVSGLLFLLSSVCLHAVEVPEVWREFANEMLTERLEENAQNIANDKPLDFIIDLGFLSHYGTFGSGNQRLISEGYYNELNKKLNEVHKPKKGYSYGDTDEEDVHFVHKEPYIILYPPCIFYLDPGIKYTDKLATDKFKAQVERTEFGNNSAEAIKKKRKVESYVFSGMGLSNRNYMTADVRYISLMDAVAEVKMYAGEPKAFYTYDVKINKALAGKLGYVTKSSQAYQNEVKANWKSFRANSISMDYAEKAGNGYLDKYLAGKIGRYLRFISTKKSSLKDLLEIQDPYELVDFVKTFGKENFRGLSTEEWNHCFDVLLTKNSNVKNNKWVTNSQEKAVVSLLEGFRGTSEEADAFLNNIYGTDSWFKAFFDRIQDKFFFIGEDNFTAANKALYKIWKKSSYGSPETNSINKSSTQSTSFPYENDKVLFWTLDDFNFYWDDEAGNIKVVQDNGVKSTRYHNGRRTVWRNVRQTEKFVYHPFTALELDKYQEVSSNNLKLATKVVPAFYMMALDQIASKENIEATAELAFDIATSFSGPGAITKLKYLKYVTNTTKAKILFSATEVGVGIADLAMDATQCQSEFCEAAGKVAFFMQLAAMKSNVSLSKIRKEADNVYGAYYRNLDNLSGKELENASKLKQAIETDPNLNIKFRKEHAVGVDAKKLKEMGETPDGYRYYELNGQTRIRRTNASNTETPRLSVDNQGKITEVLEGDFYKVADDAMDFTKSPSKLEKVKSYFKPKPAADKTVDVVVHGGGNKFLLNGKAYTENDLLKYVSELKGDKIRLLSCSNIHSAQELATRTGKKVIATPGIVKIHADGVITVSSVKGVDIPKSGNGTDWYEFVPNGKVDEAANLTKGGKRTKSTKPKEYVELGNNSSKLVNYKNFSKPVAFGGDITKTEGKKLYILGRAYPSGGSMGTKKMVDELVSSGMKADEVKGLFKKMPKEWSDLKVTDMNKKYWEVYNKPFVDEAIKSGADIRFIHNPRLPENQWNYVDDIEDLRFQEKCIEEGISKLRTYAYQEYKYLQSKGYVLKENGLMVKL